MVAAGGAESPVKGLAKVSEEPPVGELVLRSIVPAVVDGDEPEETVPPFIWMVRVFGMHAVEPLHVFVILVNTNLVPGSHVAFDFEVTDGLGTVRAPTPIPPFIFNDFLSGGRT